MVVLVGLSSRPGFGEPEFTMQVAPECLRRAFVAVDGHSTLKPGLDSGNGLIVAGLGLTGLELAECGRLAVRGGPDQLLLDRTDGRQMA